MHDAIAPPARRHPPRLPRWRIEVWRVCSDLGEPFPDRRFVRSMRLQCKPPFPNRGPFLLFCPCHVCKIPPGKPPSKQSKYKSTLQTNSICMETSKYFSDQCPNPSPSKSEFHNSVNIMGLFVCLKNKPKNILMLNKPSRRLLFWGSVRLPGVWEGGWRQLTQTETTYGGLQNIPVECPLWSLQLAAIYVYFFAGFMYHEICSPCSNCNFFPPNRFKHLSPVFSKYSTFSYDRFPHTTSKNQPSFSPGRTSLWH